MNTTTNSSMVKTLLTVFALSVIATLAGCSDETGVELSEEQNAELLARIKPAVTLDDILGKSSMVEAPAVSAPTADNTTTMADATAPAATGGEMPGMKLYSGACMACHSTGAAGAPKLGDKVAWEPRAATGMDAMLSVAKKGKGAMPPNGASAYTEAEMRLVIEYMLAEAGLQL